METCSNDIIFAITSFLLPLDLAHLALTCKWLGGGNNSTAAASSSKLQNDRRQGGWPWSTMEEASRRRISAAKNDQTNPWRDSDLITIRGEESWMAVHQRLHLLRSSYVFRRIIGTTMSYLDDDIRHIQGRRKEAKGFSVAICQEVMKEGKHYAEFTITKPGAIYMGILRPIHDWPKKKIRHVEYRSYCKAQSGPGYNVGNWDQYYYYDERVGLQRGDVFGMLLDLDRGTMTVYKNDERLGIKMKGLGGYYCWAVTMNNYGSNRASVRIGKGKIPRR